MTPCVRSQDLHPKKKKSLWESFLPFSATNSCKCIPHEMTYREKVILEGTWVASQRFAKYLFWTSSTVLIFAKFFKFKVYKLKSQTIHQVQYTCIVKYSIVIALFGVSSFSSAQWCNNINLPTITKSFQTQAYIYMFQVKSHVGVIGASTKWASSIRSRLGIRAKSKSPRW